MLPYCTLYTNLIWRFPVVPINAHTCNESDNVLYFSSLMDFLRLLPRIFFLSVWLRVFSIKRIVRILYIATFEYWACRLLASFSICFIRHMPNQAESNCARAIVVVPHSTYISQSVRLFMAMISLYCWLLLFRRLPPVRLVCSCHMNENESLWFCGIFSKSPVWNVA